MSFIRLLAAALLAAPLALAAAEPAATTPEPEAALSPHGRADACSACHDPGVDSAVGAPRPSLVNCRTCHPDADMHPVGMKPDQVPVAEGWPLEDGAMVCATCHDEAACDSPVATNPAPWLRGGTPARITDFCFRCHEADGYRRADPHHPEGEGPDGSCSACHTVTPPDQASPEASRLRSAPGELCGQCHEGQIHRGVSTHLGVVLPEAMTATLGGRLPLPADGQVQCWTCHDVHEHGASPPQGKANRRTAALRAIAREGRPETSPADPEHPPLLALPADGDELCRACHGEGGR